MNVKMKQLNEYFTKKKKVGKQKISLEKYKTSNETLNKKISNLEDDINNGFCYFNRLNFERMLEGSNEIEDFTLQLIKLNEYNIQSDKPSANCLEKFQLIYGKSLGIEKWETKKSKVMGENNPWYNHGGKFSPFKKGSINYSEEAKEKAIRNRSFNTRINFYIDKGLTEEDAKLALRERQKTFTLEKCIDKHGEIEGTKIWNDRQLRWQQTLKSKSQVEIDDINRRKSSGIGRYLDRTIPGKLYYIHFYNNEIEFWKIGITINNIFPGRFEDESVFKEKYKLNFHIEFINEYSTIQQCYNEEQYILKIFNFKRITIKYNNFNTTEEFNENVLKGFYK